MKESFPQVRFKSRLFILIGGDVVTTPDAYAAGAASYAHVGEDGVVRRFHETIGRREDFEPTGLEVEVEVEAADFLEGLLGSSWSPPL